MISYREAIDSILENCKGLTPNCLKISDTLSLTLAEDIFSPIDIPSFNQSSMDGFAICLAKDVHQNTYQVIGEIAAGSNKKWQYQPNSAVRIFTGAPIPTGYDTVVIQEKTRVDNNLLFVDNNTLLQGSNVRRRGCEIRKGDLALRKGDNITPATIGYLASMGIAEVRVFPKPRVTIIVTGNEITQPGNDLIDGQIFDANSYTLIAALKQYNIAQIDVKWVQDDLQQLSDTLANALKDSDLVLCTGGISVGEYDFVLEATIQNQVQQHFHKVKQKPGKPLYFGTKGNVIVFGLPGNPASVLTCFYLYVTTCINRLCQHHTPASWLKVNLQNPVDKNIGLTHFLKGFYDGNQVQPLLGQESFRLSSFSKANCLIKVDEETTHLAAGEQVEILLLPR